MLDALLQNPQELSAYMEERLTLQRAEQRMALNTARAKLETMV